MIRPRKIPRGLRPMLKRAWWDRPIVNEKPELCTCGGRLLLVGTCLVCEHGHGRLIWATQAQRIAYSRAGLRIVQSWNRNTVLPLFFPGAAK